MLLKAVSLKVVNSVLRYSSGSLTFGRKIRDMAGYKRISHAFEGICV